MYLTVLAQLRDFQNQTPANPEGCMIDNVPTLKCLEVIFGNIVLMSAALVFLALFIMFVVGGLSYLTSFGNPEKVKKAQGTLQYAILGFGLYLASFLILKIIDFIFLGNSGEIFRFQIPTQ